MSIKQDKTLQDTSVSLTNEQINEAYKRLKFGAKMNIESGDHEIMNKENYDKECRQWEQDTEIVENALEMAKVWQELLPLEVTQGDSVKRLTPHAGQLVNSNAVWFVTQPVKNMHTAREILKTLPTPPKESE